MIAVVAGMAFLVKISLALNTYGTNDVYWWEVFLAGARHLGALVYRVLPDFNHHSLVVQAAWAENWLTGHSGLPFQFWLRVPAILADAGGVWLTWEIMGRRVNESSIASALVLMAGAPGLIMISGFHGASDPVMIFFLLLSIWLMEGRPIRLAEGRRNLWAGAAFGMAMNKVVPLILVPVIFLYLPNFRERAKFFAGAAVAIAASWYPYVFQDTTYILGKIFGYRSMPAHWGISYLLTNLAGLVPDLQVANLAFHHNGVYLTMTLILAASVWMNRRAHRPPLFTQVGIVFFLFLSTASGFGVQYLAWLTPWVVELGVAPAATYYIASGVFLFVVYNYWSQGLPWYLADSARIGDYNGYIHIFQLACWLSVVAMLWVSLWRIRTAGTTTAPKFRFPAAGWRIAWGLPLAALLGYGAVRQISFQREASAGHVLAGGNGVLIARAETYAILSWRLSQMGRHADAIAFGLEAVHLNATADTYAVLAAVYAGAREWEKATANADLALSLDSGSELAKGVLRAACTR